jgi:phosphoglycerate kinase
VVKNGRIKDPYRIDASLGTIYTIVERGGRPILMTHIGRPMDKKTGKIFCKEGQSVKPIARYLEQKIPIKIHVQEFPVDGERGIPHLDQSIKPAIEDLKKGKIGMIYLPNTRWFQGEQSEGSEREVFAKELAGIADLYVNDAFGSYRAHVSTYDIARHLPSYAGVLIQRELRNLHKVIDPERPFLAVIAGSKYDTKIDPLKVLYTKVDCLILGGVMYNAFISAKYGVQIAGVPEEDRALAMEIVKLDQKDKKILEMPYMTESETLKGKIKGKYRSVYIRDFKKGKRFGYILDIDPKSFEARNVKEAIGSAKTVFVNAVMGLMPYFPEGSRALYRLIASNESALKLFGGGDTLQELRNLCPWVYLSELNASDSYYFTGGGSVLAAIEQGSPYNLKPIRVLMDKK